MPEMIPSMSTSTRAVLWLLAGNTQALVFEHEKKPPQALTCRGSFKAININFSGRPSDSSIIILSDKDPESVQNSEGKVRNIGEKVRSFDNVFLFDTNQVPHSLHQVNKTHH